MEIENKDFLVLFIVILIVILQYFTIRRITNFWALIIASCIPFITNQRIQKV